MQVFDDHQQRSVRGHRFGFGQHEFEQAFHVQLLLRARPVLLGQLYRQQRCEEPHRFLRIGRGVLELLVHLGQGHHRRVVVRETGAPLHPLDQGMQRLVLMKSGAVVGERDQRLVGEAVGEGPDEARLADARFSGQQDDLALAAAGRLPAVGQEVQLAGAVDEGHQFVGPPRLALPIQVAGAAHLPGRDGQGDSFQGLRTQALKLEGGPGEIAGHAVDHHAVRLRQGLQAGRYVGCFADRGDFLCRPDTDKVADHHRTGADADTGLQAQTGLRTQPCDRPDDFQAGVDRPLRIVFMGARKAEVDENAVTHIARDETFHPRNDTGAGVLIGTHDGAQVVRVVADRQLRRSDEITEHHRQVALFGAGA